MARHRRHLTDDEISRIVEGIWQTVSDRLGTGSSASETSVRVGDLIRMVKHLRRIPDVSRGQSDELNDCSHCRTRFVTEFLGRARQAVLLGSEGHEALRTVFEAQLDQLWDAELVVRTRAENEETNRQASNALHERYEAFVLSICRRYAQRDAEDVAQEVWVKLPRKLESYDARKGTFKCWLRVVVIRTAIDWRRHRNRGVQIVGKSIEELADELAQVEPSPADRAELAERLANVIQVCHRVLSPHEKEIFILRWEHGCNYDEIAKRLGMKRPSVKAAYTRALRRVREELKRGGF